ncbi:Telomerase reverse transcriptase [Lecanicillium sp. MT-2017a]|nr:Telomerase reverse transcriptase [Lecanicillium sp. MT-2017a]
MSEAELSKAEERNTLKTVKVMMYMFPRQFGLHNVFSSNVDPTMTTQKFQDYTLREEEIAKYLKSDTMIRAIPKIPKRMRGSVKTLVRSLQVHHGRCSYFELLRHYCPSMLDESIQMASTAYTDPSGNLGHGNHQPGSASTQRRRRKTPKDATNDSSQLLNEIASRPIVELATPTPKVSTFIQAAVLKIMPGGFWGTGDDGDHNRSIIGQKINHFITLRRYESANLHDLLQGFKLSNLEWLQLPNQGTQKPSQTETKKQQEIFLEFLYYVFDSLVMPLLRSCFYITESNSHRHKVFYFRHDIWRLVCESAMLSLKSDMLEEFKPKIASNAMAGRQLGYSHIRLLPKGHKLRPIMNLRRRYASRVNNKVLVPSINTVLAPIHNMLKFERDAHPFKLRSTLFSVGDMYKKIKTFKAQLGESHTKLYFAKLDVQAAFDTIPQDAVLRLMGSVPSHPNYKVVKHAEVKPGEQSLAQADDENNTTKPIRRWNWAALPGNDTSTFTDRLENQLGGQRKSTVFVNSTVQKYHNTRSLLQLLTEHVKENLIKVGKKYYRQKRGIPQGSVLSSFLCNYFYADLELKHLDFVDGPDCLLLRLIDDFLLITLDKTKAQRFVDIMHAGLPEYGVQVNQNKSLVNFASHVNGQELPRTPNGAEFPYCGTLINCDTLDISKDVSRDRAIDISHTLTVEYSRNPGQSFERKVLHAFKIQSHLMLYDTSHNSTHTVLASLRDAFAQTALKMWAYTRSLGKQNCRRQQPRPNLVIRAIGRTIDVAHLVLTSRFRNMKHEGYACSLRKSQIALVAYEAFERVLQRKQTGYDEVLAWISQEKSKLK